MSSASRTAIQTTATASATSAPARTTEVQREAGPSVPINTLRLRAEPEEQRRIRWAEDVIDNEGMGKKKSKVCCIYHKPKEPGDSDTDDSDSPNSDSEADDEPDLSRAQRPAGGSGHGRGRRHANDCGGGKGGGGKGKERRASPNAYERQPQSKKEG